MQGADQLQRRLAALRAIKAEVVEEIEATATDVEIAAYRAAPVSIGQKISKVAERGGLTMRIEVNAGKIGAYTEFGTGQSAAALVPTLEPEWQDIARRFYINGQGRLIAQPYLYPNWVRYTAGFQDRIRKILEKAANL